jgi:hypothetical protein
VKDIKGFLKITPSESQFVPAPVIGWNAIFFWFLYGLPVATHIIAWSVSFSFGSYGFFILIYL